MERIVAPEILDTLDWNDPRAMANRKDIHLLNKLMGNFRWFASCLRKIPEPNGILELGAGDGSLGSHLARQGVINGNIPYCGVDMIPRPVHWPREWEWRQADIRHIEVGPHHSTLLANLILHQFGQYDLLRIGTAIQQSRIRQLLICEPARKRIHQWQMRLTRLIGIGGITQHDARVSIRAGFRSDEAFWLLGLERAKWQLVCSESFLGANRLICIRQ